MVAIGLGRRRRSNPSACAPRRRWVILRISLLLGLAVFEAAVLAYSTAGPHRGGLYRINDPGAEAVCVFLLPLLGMIGLAVPWKRPPTRPPKGDEDIAGT